MVVLLVPCDPRVMGRVDSALRAEAEAGRRVGFRVGLLSHEALWEGDVESALEGVYPAQEDGTRVVLRSWMLPEDRYRAWYEGMRGLGYVPVSKPEEYAEAHYLPLGYRHIEGHAGRSVWMEGDDEEEAWRLYAREMRSGDAIVKDWVKSAKKRWKDGCFLKAGTSREEFGETFRVFRHARGGLFNRGVVFREFLPIVERGGDVRGLPVVDETRLFFWRGELILEPREEEDGPLCQRARWEEIARKFASPFVTVDVARLTDGSWRVVEVGAGEVSGLPVGVDPERFYAAFWNRLAVDVSI